MRRLARSARSGANGSRLDAAAFVSDVPCCKLTVPLHEFVEALRVGWSEAYQCPHEFGPARGIALLMHRRHHIIQSVTHEIGQVKRPVSARCGQHGFIRLNRGSLSHVGHAIRGYWVNTGFPVACRT